VHLAQTELRGLIDAALDFLPPDTCHRPGLVRWQRRLFSRRPENLL
jgi:hypothetical protein